LIALQNEALGPRREELVQLAETVMSYYGVTFDDLLGSIDRAFEVSIIELPFAFWQYGSQDGCARIPSPTASTDEIFQFIEWFNDLYFYSDEDVGAYLAYYV
jgi:hypothetical protein